MGLYAIRNYYYSTLSLWLQHTFGENKKIRDSFFKSFIRFPKSSPDVVRYGKVCPVGDQVEGL